MNPNNTGSNLTNRGFTLIELVIVMVIVAIGVALAVPSWTSLIEKRRLVSATEAVESFMNIAQSEAVKRNQEVTVSWISTVADRGNFCLGFSAPPQTAPCDCNETIDTEDDFCSVGSVPYRLTKVDFVDLDYNFIRMLPTTGDFGFDPVRGIVVNTSDSANEELSDIVDDENYLFLLRSDAGDDVTRLFELQMRLNRTGRFKTCYDGKMAIGAFPEC